MKKLAIMFCMVTCLAGCATPYQSAGITGGFSETQLDKNVFRVAFQGNGYTSQTRAEEMTLLRAAELTLQKGFTHFSIIDGRTRESQSMYMTPMHSYTYGGTTTTYGGQMFLTSSPTSSITIECFNEKPATNSTRVFDAKFLCESLGKKYEVVCGAPRS